MYKQGHFEHKPLKTFLGKNYFFILCFFFYKTLTIINAEFVLNLTELFSQLWRDSLSTTWPYIVQFNSIKKTLFIHLGNSASNIWLRFFNHPVPKNCFVFSFYCINKIIVPAPCTEYSKMLGNFPDFYFFARKMNFGWGP